jgi:copper resistance protein C
MAISPTNQIRACFAALGLLLSAASHAHAFLDHAEPRVGSTVSTAPAEVKLWFSEPLEPAFSTIELTDAQGRRVDAEPAHVDAADPALLRVPLLRIGPGDYTAIWRVISVDTHVTEGRFVFHVAP